jgi:rubrerythrin
MYQRKNYVPTLPPRISQNQWELDLCLPLVHTIPTQYWDNVSPVVIDNFSRLLSRDVYSEGDAQILYDYIISRQQEMSPAFLQMMDLWLEDEMKHYEALRRVYHCITQVDFAQMDQQFSERDHHFEPIQMVLVDEFTILVTLMFDEIGSVYSYRRDLHEYYQHFGEPIRKIGHHLVKDEGQHFNNAAELLLSYHSHRLVEVKELLQNISQLESSLKRYHKTFFLDHAQEQYRFPKDFNSIIIQVILARLGLAAKPNSQDLQKLWQWVPSGYVLVPILSDSNSGQS